MRARSAERHDNRTASIDPHQNGIVETKVMKLRNDKSNGGKGGGA
jgi:hypothetical protein